MDRALRDSGSVCQGPIIRSGAKYKEWQQIFYQPPPWQLSTKENFGQKAKWFCVPSILHFLCLWHWSKFPVRWSDTRMTINLSVSISRLIYCQSRPGSHFLCRHHTTGSKSQKAVKTCKGFLKFFCEGECTENVHFAKSKNIIIPNFSTFFLIQHPNQLLFKWWRIV